MNYLLKNGLYALMCLTILSSCSKDDDDEDPAAAAPAVTTTPTATEIGAITITTAPSGDGTILSVTPTASGATSFSVDFGTTTDATDTKTTAGPAVTYDYPNNATATEYTVTVTASATGLADKTKMETVTITLVLSDAVGNWVLLHEAGALAVGPTADDLSWWSSTIATVGKRDCLFDDIYKLNADGSFLNVIGTETWLEPYSNSASPEECGTATSPYDGTATATWAYDQTKGTIIITGKGAYLGIPKAFNGGEFNADGTDFPAAGENEITYTSVTFSEDKKTMTMKINYTLGFWQFKFAKVGSAGASSPTTDTDGDGVLDINDACADTLSGATVDATGCPPAGSAVILPTIDFENFDTDTTPINNFNGGVLTVETNPQSSGINTSSKVGKMVKSDGEVWGGSTIKLAAPIDLSTAKKKISMKVYIPAARTGAIAGSTSTSKVLLKLENLTISTENVEVIITTVATGWQTLTFDYTADVTANPTNSYQKVVIIFENGTVGAGGADWTFLVDDITQID